MGGADDRLFDSKRKWIMKYIQRHIPSVQFLSNQNKNDTSRIGSDAEGMKTLMLQLAEDEVKHASETHMTVLRRAACILRNIALDFRKSRVTSFQGSISPNANDAPLELEMFLKWLLAGTRKLNETTNEQVDCLGNPLRKLYFIM